MIFDIILDFIFNSLQWSGIFSFERKIERKIKKVSKYYPEVEKYYIYNQREFETNEELINKLFSVNEKNSTEVLEFYQYCKTIFGKGYYV